MHRGQRVAQISGIFISNVGYFETILDEPNCVYFQFLVIGIPQLPLP